MLKIVDFKMKIELPYPYHLSSKFGRNGVFSGRFDENSKPIINLLPTRNKKSKIEFPDIIDFSTFMSILLEDINRARSNTMSHNFLDRPINITPNIPLKFLGFIESNHPQISYVSHHAHKGGFPVANKTIKGMGILLTTDIKNCVNLFIIAKHKSDKSKNRGIAFHIFVDYFPEKRKKQLEDKFSDEIEDNDDYVFEAFRVGGRLTQNLDAPRKDAVIRTVKMVGEFIEDKKMRLVRDTVLEAFNPEENQTAGIINLPLREGDSNELEMSFITAQDLKF